MPATKHDVKLRKMEIQAAKDAQKMLLLRQLIASPAFQMIGTVAITEILEEAGVLSGRWAGALEGGVIAMTGLQALKDYGVIGASTLGLGISAGSLLGQLESKDMSAASKGLLEGLLGYPARYLK